MDYEKQIKRIIDYIKAGEKKPADYEIGIEFEHFILKADDFQTVSYYGPNGIGETLEEIRQAGWIPYYDQDHLLGLRKEPFAITTEPGSQFEVSIDASQSIQTLETNYCHFFQMILPYFEKKNQMVVALGYHPVTKIEEIKMLPKRRYDFMYEYFKQTGTQAHNMMKGTCAIQVTIDFSDEVDFIKKIRVGNSLSPILYTMMDNALLFEGEIYPHHNLRQHIWENTDSKRSGILITAFDQDFGYRKYAQFILNTNIIFIEKNGKLISTEGKLFKELFDPDKHGDDLIEHALSIVFPDLRVKRYLEFRMMDAASYPLNFGVVALIKGLFYHQQNLDQLWDLFKDNTFRAVREAKEDSNQHGMKGHYLGLSLIEWARKLLEMAQGGLSREEQPYLEPLWELAGKGMNPRDQFQKIYEQAGMAAAIQNATIRIGDGHVQ